MQQPIRVRYTKNGAHWRLWWIDQSGQMGREGAGARSKVSERQVQQLAAQKQHELNAGVKASARMTLSTLKSKYPEIRSSKLKPGTAYLHDRTLDLLIEHFKSDRQIAAINPLAAKGWRNWLEAKGLAEPTVCLFVTKAKAIFEKAVEVEWLGRNPFGKVESSDTTRGAKSYISIEVYDKLMGACECPGDRCLLALARLGGLRRGEAVLVDREDIDLSGGVLVANSPKTAAYAGHAVRKVPIMPALAEVLREYAPKSGPIVRGLKGDPVTARQADRMAGRIIAAAKVKPYPKPMHSLRASCENDWVARFPWPDVCQWMGHSPQVAMRNYLDTPPETWARATGIGAK